MPTPTAVLLVNLGTPDSPEYRDVARYLREFLLDPRVLDIPVIKRQLLVRGIIAPFRSRSSGRTYREIWTDEGSPLLVYSEAMVRKLQASLGSEYRVILGMRYQNPSLESALETLRQEGCKRLIVVPLFPQYASASTGSAHQKVMELLSRWPTIPDCHFINSYPTQQAMIQAFAERAREQELSSYDHVIQSFHGLPERQIRACDDTQRCLVSADCCEKAPEDSLCYRAQCLATAKAIAKELELGRESWTISFQSRLGRDPWIQPFTPDILKKLAEQGKKRVLVLCPAFVCDCLETTYEIGVEAQEDFEKWGGEKVQLVEGLGSHPMWIQALKELVEERAPMPV